mmetsp:Transcript_59022/g.93928  ORF Transcript_59022/g.93928 Transcript_59022/m.93928 type:complete len:241 (+) Transcript_59022:162-884(+)
MVAVLFVDVIGKRRITELGTGQRLVLVVHVEQNVDVEHLCQRMASRNVFRYVELDGNGRIGRVFVFVPFDRHSVFNLFVGRLWRIRVMIIVLGRLRRGRRRRAGFRRFGAVLARARAVFVARFFAFGRSGTGWAFGVGIAARFVFFVFFGFGRRFLLFQLGFARGFGELRWFRLFMQALRCLFLFVLQEFADVVHFGQTAIDVDVFLFAEFDQLLLVQSQQLVPLHAHGVRCLSPWLLLQ